MVQSSIVRQVKLGKEAHIPSSKTMSVSIASRASFCSAVAFEALRNMCDNLPSGAFPSALPCLPKVRLVSAASLLRTGGFSGAFLVAVS